MTRKFLQGLGVEAETIETIMATHSDTVQREIDKTNDWKEKFNALKNGSGDDWKNKLEVEESAHADTKKLLTEAKEKLTAEENAHTATKAAHEEEKTTEKKRQAVIAQLIADGANETYVKYCANDFDLSKVELADDGTITDWETVAKPHKETHADIFQEADTSGAYIPNPPRVDTGNKPIRPHEMIGELNKHRLIK